MVFTMSYSLLLTLASALAWACFDAVRKGLARDVRPLQLGLWLPVAQAPLLALWAAGQEPFRFAPAALPAFAASALLNVLALLAFLDALRRSPISLTIPLLSFTPVIATLLAWVFRGQVPSGMQWAGSALVVAGALLLGITGGSWRGLGPYLREPGVGRMTLAATLWSATAMLDQVALQRGVGAWYAPALTAVVAVPILAWMLVRSPLKDMADGARALLRRPGLGAAAVVVGASALAVQLEALRVAPVGFIEVVKRGVGMASAVLVGRWLFAEPLTGEKLGAVVLLTLGVALVVGLG